jgi:hypothetical protein
VGGKTQSQGTQEAITQQQLQIGQRQQAVSEEDRARALELEQPAIDFSKALISGDPGTLMTAAAPIIGNVARGYQKTKDSIFDTVAPGAGRDFAVASLERDRPAATATTLNQLITGAYDKLANIGSGFGSFSLSELGAGLRGFEGASSTNQALMQNEAQRKSSTMSFLGSLVGGGATAFAGRH